MTNVSNFDDNKWNFQTCAGVTLYLLAISKTVWLSRSPKDPAPRLAYAWKTMPSSSHNFLKVSKCVSDNNYFHYYSLPDFSSSKQGMTLILNHTWSGKIVLATEVQQLSQLSHTEVADPQWANSCPNMFTHASVRLQSHVWCPVGWDHL